MKDKQEQVDKFLQQFEVPYWQPLEIMARLTEEVGELAREINHRFGPKKKKSSEDKQDLGDEIADVLFTLFALANSQDIKLDDHFDKIIDKYGTRDEERWEKKK